MPGARIFLVGTKVEKIEPYLIFGGGQDRENFCFLSAFLLYFLPFHIFYFAE